MSDASVGGGLPKFLPWLPSKRVWLVVVLMALTGLVGELWRPTYRIADHKPKINLAAQVPEQFGDWQIDKSISPILPDPSLQARLDELYSQTLARTYVNSAGKRVMLSIAYGSDQGSEATAVHRPEFCYSAQGFRIRNLGAHGIELGKAPLQVARLVGQIGQRTEPITYWITLDESATLPGFGRKMQQIRFGVQGKIPDGMLVRVSSISNSEPDSFELQRTFLEQMFLAVPLAVRNRYFGERGPPA
jgi:EpsI family protein